MRKKTQPTPAQFRPGPELGRMLDDLAADEGVSIGEVAKRLTSLTLRGLSRDFYPYVCELASLKETTDFDEAAAELAQAVLVVPAGKPKAHRVVKSVTSPESLLAADRYLEHYRCIDAVQHL